MNLICVKLVNNQEIIGLHQTTANNNPILIKEPFEIIESQHVGKFQLKTLGHQIDLILEIPLYNVLYWGKASDSLHELYKKVI